MADRYREMAQKAQLKLAGQDRNDLPSDDAAAAP
jgi:hypothetical protein